MCIFADLHLEVNMDTSWLKGWYLKQSQTWVPIIVQLMLSPDLKTLMRTIPCKKQFLNVVSRNEKMIGKRELSDYTT